MTVDHLPTKQIPPAQLFVGQEQFVVEQVVAYLQKIFCPLLRQAQDERGVGCRACTACSQIARQQHHAVIWLTTEKKYTLEQIAVINETIGFALDTDQHFFFVVQKADLLSTACANSLLKSVEEPPPGYHFLFVTERRDALLPTIQSRCTSYTWRTTTQNSYIADIVAFFKQTGPSDPVAFLKEIENKHLHEQATIQAMDALLAHWFAQHKEAIIANNNAQQKNALRMITALKEASKRPPMPGSSKLFWKELLLQTMP